MKTLLIILSMALNLAFASARFTENDKTEFMIEVKYQVQEFKQDNNGKIDVIIMKPGLYAELDKYYGLHKFTKEEMAQIKDAYEAYSKISENQYDEQKFYDFISAQLDKIASAELKKIKAGEICNSFICEDGLTCARDPKQKNTDNKLAGGAQCKADKECASNECIVSPKDKTVKICESIKRCYQPVKVGSSCKDVPVCEKGACLPFDQNTIGIGECVAVKNKCSSNDQCCSGLCESNKCVENLICKDCVSKGMKADGNKKCCEGLIKNSSNICIPDMPPIIPPQVNNTVKNSILVSFVSLFISNASADESFDTVNGNRSKYSQFTATSEAVDTVDMANGLKELKFTQKSNFETCEMHFREDFYAYLKKNKLFDLEVSLLAFDYMLLGDSNADYWAKTKGSNETSIWGRLNTVAKAHDIQRTQTNAKIAEIDRKLTCMCLDVKGIKNVTNQDQVSYFNEKCTEFKTAMNSDMNKASCSNLAGEKESWAKACLVDNPTMSSADCDSLKSTLESKETTCNQNPTEVGVNNDTTDGDASGVKAKRLLVYYTAQMSAFNQSLTVDNTKIYEGIAKVKTWMDDNQLKLATTDYESDEGLQLSGFTIKNPSGSAAAIGAALGAMLAAGVIAVLGGFAASSMISTWAAAGIISAAAVSGGGGVWLVASLKGAWIAKHPEVYDKYIRTYGCGKKDTCTDYQRMLKQPYSQICDAHISNNACIRNFVTYNLNGEPRYVVDPFIPYGIAKSDILRGQGDYAKSLEAGYQRALSYMQSISPRGQVGEGVMSSEFISEYVVGLYTLNPGLGSDPEGKYALNDALITQIKDKAKAFAIEKQFLNSSDKENLDKFADYAYEYHFLWPKTTKAKEISYPTVALDTYMEFMSNGVAASLSAGSSSAATTFGGLNTQYLQDYLNTLKIYDQSTSGLSSDAQANLKAEIAAVENAIAANKAVQSIMSSPNSSLSNIGSSGLNSSSLNGTSGNSSLSTTQMQYLNAVGKYRNLRNDQLKKLEAYNKALANKGSSSTSSSASRSASVSNAVKSFSSKFGSGALASLGSGTTSTTGSSANSATDARKVLGYGSGSTNPYGSSGSSSGNSSMGSKSGSSSSGSSSQAVGDANASASGSNEDEDAKRLKEAIEARNKASAGKYSSNENSEQTIFQKVTNAYIRNYDKVLTKKKSDKDVNDDKSK